jgi:shikimate kinase
VLLVNRTHAKAVEAADALGCEALPFEQIGEALAGAHLLVSCISSDTRVVPPALLSRGLTLLEANYGRPTALLRDAADAGCRIIDGRLWLLNQAIPAFTLFTGKEAPAAEMRKALFKRRWAAHKNVALIGFMGTGKSSVAHELARVSGLAFVDTDKAVEARAGLSVSEIFETKGEAAFRLMEQDELQGLWNASHTVVSCGGGAVLARSNRRALRSRCIPVWLWADIQTALARLREAGTRPLLDGADPESRANALLEERRYLYARTSDLVINTRGKAPLEIAARIWDEVHYAFDS